MIVTDEKPHILNLINESNNILILPSKNRGEDALYSAVALALLIKRQGKEVSILHEGDLPQELVNYKDLVSIKGKFDQRSLIISVDYNNTPIEKVNYLVEDGVLNFFVTPIPQNFDINRVSFGKSGLKNDLFIVVGATSLEELGSLYDENSSEFKKVPILNIDNIDETIQYGTVNVIDASFDSLSEMILNKIVQWGLKIDKELANILLEGIRKNIVP